MPSASAKALDVLSSYRKVFAPDVEDKGVNWEIHIEEHDRDARGYNEIMAPMPPRSDAEKP
jgi:hypothetical protein